MRAHNSAVMGSPVRQVAYIVQDVRASAVKHSRVFGSGPFFVLNAPPSYATRAGGEPMPLDMTAAVGQWGDIQIELMQVNRTPTAFTEFMSLGSGSFGLHHVCIFAEDVERAAAELGAAG